MDTNLENPFACGAIEREPTASDIAIGAVTPQQAIPPTYMVDGYGIEIENQGQQPACGAHAGYEVASIFKTVERKSVFHGSPKYLWDRIKMIDGYAPKDGTDMPSIMKTLATYGICDISLMPNTVTQSLADYSAASNVTGEMDANAANNKIGPIYAFGWSPTFEQLKEAIYAHGAVVLLAKIGAEFWLPSFAEADLLPLKPNTYPITSGHFITAFGYDQNYIYFYNHWGNKWGRAGIGYFGQDYVGRILEYGTSTNLAGKFTFQNDLKLGSTGSDVSVLQLVLRQLGFFPKTQKITGLFGSITLQAVKDFQQAYAADILTPAGATSPTGMVLHFTRAKLNELITKTN